MYKVLLLDFERILTMRHTHIDTHTHIQTDRQTDRQTDIQTYRNTCRHTYIHTDRQTYIHTYIHEYVRSTEAKANHSEYVRSTETKINHNQLPQSESMHKACVCNCSLPDPFAFNSASNELVLQETKHFDHPQR